MIADEVAAALRRSVEPGRSDPFVTYATSPDNMASARGIRRLGLTAQRSTRPPTR